MLNLTDGMLLYHGSYCEIPAPDLDKISIVSGRGMHSNAWNLWEVRRYGKSRKSHR